MREHAQLDLRVIRGNQDVAGRRDERAADLASELGVAEEAFLRNSYWGLWLAAREEDADLPEDMVFAR